MSKHTPLVTRSHPIGNGSQTIYKFPNGYGASVVQFRGSYGYESGKFELAVLKFEGDNWSLTYETPITEDVLGHLSPEEIESTLDSIEQLPAIAKAEGA